MNRKYCIYTVEANCQDCYKCLRHCPVKAIRIIEGHATIISEACVACGHCVAICPAKAKTIRNDVSRVQYLIAKEKPVYAVLAPSVVGAFEGVKTAQVIAGLEALGFAGVVEAALGAQEVTAWTAEQLVKASEPKLHLSTACPAVVQFIRLQMPAMAQYLTPIASPAETAANMLRQHCDQPISVIFIGPCIAKKNEARDDEDGFSLALTFRELEEWLEAEAITLSTLTTSVIPPVLEVAEEGRLYPIEGGMIETMRPALLGREVNLHCLVGLESIEDNLNKIDPAALKRGTFIELLACVGGCLNGPGGPAEAGRLTAEQAVRDSCSPPRSARAVRYHTARRFPAIVRDERQWKEEEVLQSLRRIGKQGRPDELNCGACGYETCRGLAKAMLEERAEPAMCLSYMRRLAQKKANALLACMPNAVVIINREMKVVECNAAFAQLFGEGTEIAFEVCPGLAGANIERIVPFPELFRAALNEGRDITRENLRVDKTLFNITVFTLEAHTTVGAVIQDVTHQELRRELIAQRARKVIRQNITTVQEIACLLGEHVSETEILLSAIADDYAPDALLGDLLNDELEVTL